MVEKIKRDVRITTIYEGTSEIMEMTVARDRWQQHLKTRGEYYHQLGQELELGARAHPELGGDIAGLAHHALAELLEACRLGRLTRHQHVLLRLGELVATVEGAGALVRRVARALDGELGAKLCHRFAPDGLAAMSRVYAREAALSVGLDGMRWVAGAGGADGVGELAGRLRLSDIQAAQPGLLSDMNAVADVVYGRRES